MSKGGYQKKRLEEKKARAKEARRRARRRKLLATWGTTIAVFALILVVVLVIIGGDDTDPTASPSPTPTPTEATLPDGCTDATPSSEQKAAFDAAPKMQIDPQKSYIATMETNCGTMTIELFAKDAPETVNNFAFLAGEDFFDGLLFHRVIDHFMIQGGDPQGTGAGGPGYAFDDENTERPFDERGLLAMANSGPATNGSQFFITDEVITHLNAPGQCPGPQGCHSIFGKVVEGLDVLDRITSVTTDGDPPVGQSRPLVPMVILDVTVAEA